MADESAQEKDPRANVVEVQPMIDGGVADLVPITTGQIRRALLAQPLTLCSIIPFGLIGAYGYPREGGAGLSWPHVGWGALGWYGALVLRAPIIGVAQALKLSPQWTQLVAVLASGPCEEVVRALALWAWPGQHDFHSAFSLGVGWAGIEVVFTVIQGLVMIKLLGKNDDKAREVRQKLLDFVGRDTAQDSPFWAPLERVGANMGHIWFTLAARLHPALFVPVAVVHSCTNWGIVSSIKRFGIARVELAFVALSASFFLAIFFTTRPGA